MSDYMSPEELSALYSAPSAQVGPEAEFTYEGGPQSFSYEQGALYESSEPWDQPQEAYAPPPQAPPPQEEVPPQHYEQPQQPPLPPADPLRASQASAWEHYQYESQLAAQRADYQQRLASQRHNNQQQIETRRYQIAMQQLQGTGESRRIVAPPSDLNRDYYARRTGFFWGLAVGAAGMAVAWTLKSWWGRA